MPKTPAPEAAAKTAQNAPQGLASIPPSDSRPAPVAALEGIISREAAAQHPFKRKGRSNYALNLGGSFDVVTFEDRQVAAVVADPAALTEQQRTEIAAVVEGVRAKLKSTPAPPAPAAPAASAAPAPAPAPAAPAPETPPPATPA